ncbi:MAG: hypothetical protein E7291_07095 [Lachnospiraceae bacterium]|nr:hypothetical protein [Lachnospiraceae bacterium]
MNRKNLPLILMLVAGAVTCIISLIQKYSVLRSLISLFIVLVIFFFLGSVMKWTLDYFEREIEKRSQEEGEVITKEAENEEGNSEGNKEGNKEEQKA